MDNNKKNLADELYKKEELIWANLTSAYYAPHGAPGRLSGLLLEQWHQKNNTGARDPNEIQSCLVKVYVSDNSYMVKRFVTKNSATRYVDDLKEHNIEAEIFDTFTEVHGFGQ